MDELIHYSLTYKNKLNGLANILKNFFSFSFKGFVATISIYKVSELIHLIFFVSKRIMHMYCFISSNLHRMF